MFYSISYNVTVSITWGLPSRRVKPCLWCRHVTSHTLWLLTLKSSRLILSFPQSTMTTPVCPGLSWPPRCVQACPGTDFIPIHLVFRWCTTHNCTLVHKQLRDIQSDWNQAHLWLANHECYQHFSKLEWLHYSQFWTYTKISLLHSLNPYTMSPVHLQY